MPSKEILQIGHIALRTICKPVADFQSNEISQTVKDMIDTLQAWGPGVGLAAPQIGYNYRIFITEIRAAPHRGIEELDETRVYINPEIIELSSELVTIHESCSSISNGNLIGPVSRPQIVTIKAQKLDGSFFTIKCNGLLARVFLHEYDHLNGILFLDLITDQKTLFDRSQFKEIISQTPDFYELRRITIKEIFQDK
jgi:peptide deformylase